jgi:hypothetical protein
LATDPGAGKDLRTYLSENAPLAPHRAALLVASLAEQMAAVHAGGRTYADVRAETVRVDADSARVTVDSPVVALGGVGSAANVRAAGALLALLLGGWPGGRRPNGVPAELWRLVDACAGRAPPSSPAGSATSSATCCWTRGRSAPPPHRPRRRSRRRCQRRRRAPGRRDRATGCCCWAPRASRS